MLPKIT